jgi:PHP family Zn ribbon phosphoesterase
MTKESRILFELTDIISINFECQNCGGKIGFSPQNWKSVPCKCSNCGGLLVAAGSDAEKLLGSLSENLKGLGDPEKKLKGLNAILRMEFSNEGKAIPSPNAPED